METPLSEPTSEKVTSVAKAGSIMAGSLLLSRILGMLRDTAMAYQFGFGLDADAYRLAITIPDALFMLIAGGGLSSAFIPVFSEYWYTDRRKEAWRLFSVVTTFFALTVSLLIFGAWVLAPQIAAFVAHGKPAADPVLFQAKVAMIGRILLPAQFAFFVGSLLFGTLYARKEFLAAALAPNFYNVGIIGGAMLLPRMLGMGIEGMAWGALTGATIGNLILPAIKMVRIGSNFSPSLDLKTEGVSKFFKLFAPVVFGFSLPSMATLIMTKFSTAYGEGSNSILNAANTLMQAPNGIFGQSMALAALPILAQFVAQGDMDKYRLHVSSTLRTVLFLSIPAAVVLAALAPEVTRVLFGYGKAAMTGDKLDQIAECLRVFSIGIVAWCLQPVLMRGFFSLHKTFKPVALSTGLTIAYIVLLSVVPRSVGLIAIPWATNLVVWILALVLYLALELEVGALERSSFIVTGTKSLVAAVPAGAVGWGVAQAIPHSTSVANLGVFFVAFCGAGWTYFFASVLLKMPEAEFLRRGMNRLQRKTSASKASN